MNEVLTSNLLQEKEVAVRYLWVKGSLCSKSCNPIARFDILRSNIASAIQCFNACKKTLQEMDSQVLFMY